MEKINSMTPDLTQENIAKLAEIFPDVVTESVDSEGKLSLSVDFDALQENLSVDACLSSYPKERYQFTWPGKREAKLEARRPINKTLKPCPEKSVNWDTTENIYIEGDNLEALKIMRETYMHKVKMIYIDPPYNTGHDFVYKDNFAQSREEYLNEDGSYDEEGNRLEENLESNGRFHSDWCSMMYSRLLLARDFLTDDGVIFISIDDNEQKNLKNITDEIFGEMNFLAQVVWERAYAPINLMKHFSSSHDYVLCYAKNIDSAVCRGIIRSADANSRYVNRDNDPRGPWKSSDLSVGPAIEKNIYPITTPSGRVVEPPAGRSWSLSRKAFRERLEDNRIWFGKDGNSVPSMKRFFSELRKPGVTPMTLWKYTEVGHSQEATQSLSKLFGGYKVFDYPKPLGLIERCLQLYTSDSDIILDFFSGSATLAHAVMNLNASDGGKRRYICIQMSEECGEGTSAYNLGYNTVCEIGEDRIRKAGRLITKSVDESNIQLSLEGDEKQLPDIGFKVFRVTETNFKELAAEPGEVTQMQIDQLSTDNLKENSSSIDLLYEVFPSFRIDYSADVETEILFDKEVFVVNGNQLVACFDTDITNGVIQAIAEIQPLYAVFRDASFANEAARTNLEEIFKAFSPDTQLRVI